MRLAPEEPDAAPWVRCRVAELVDQLLGPRGRLFPPARPKVLAVDGRSAGGKTTLAARIAAAVPDTYVVHTDDIAWWHSFFDWAPLMRSGVLAPLVAGQGVRYRPPAYDDRGRDDAVVVPAGAWLVVVEGVGAAQRDLYPFYDAVVWVQSDLDVRAARDDARVAAGEVDRALVTEWLDAEWGFVADQRPWERAEAVVLGTPEPHMVSAPDEVWVDAAWVTAARQDG